jgi:hypothetical protein
MARMLSERSNGDDDDGGGDGARGAHDVHGARDVFHETLIENGNAVNSCETSNANESGVFEVTAISIGNDVEYESESEIRVAVCENASASGSSNSTAD